MTVAMIPGERADEHAFLDSVDGEISFFRSIMRARPVGVHRHFHILTIRNAILKDTGRSVHIETIWEKLRKFYDLDALDAIVSRFIIPNTRRFNNQCLLVGYRSRGLPFAEIQFIPYIHTLTLTFRKPLRSSFLSRGILVTF